MPCTNGGGAIPKSQSTDPLDSPTLNRRKFFEYFRKLFLNDFEFIDIRDDLNQLLLTEDECRLILHEPTLNKQLERLFFLLTYNEKKSIRAFVDGIRQVYPWLSTAMDKYHDRSSEDLDAFEKCINCSWLPNKRNVRVYRCELVSKHNMLHYILVVSIFVFCRLGMNGYYVSYNLGVDFLCHGAPRMIHVHNQYKHPDSRSPIRKVATNPVVI